MPTSVEKPPEGDEWNHEVKFDGYRSQIVRDAEVVRIFTRRGFRSPYPSITARSHPVMASKSIDFVVSTSNSGPRRSGSARFACSISSGM